MKYSSIQINNFRSITDLHIENFKQINLITGRNNCGKTTVLEALFLISGMSNPQLPILINNFRDFFFVSDDDFTLNFHNLDFRQDACLSAVLNGDKRRLIIKPRYSHQKMKNLYNNDKINLIPEKKTVTNTNAFSKIDGIILEFEENEQTEPFRSEISLSTDAMSLIDNRYEEKVSCTFHSPQHYMSMLPQRIEKLLLNKQMAGVIESLKKIDAKITDIHTGPSGRVYLDTGFDKLFPINLMGDGTRRILSILTNISDTQGGVLLIDEVENGLHYSSLEILWQAVLKAAETYNVQLFITTHSNECVAALASGINEQTDNVRLYRLEKHENNHRAFEYSPDMILTGIESNIEMR